MNTLQSCILYLLNIQAISNFFDIISNPVMNITTISLHSSNFIEEPPGGGAAGSKYILKASVTCCHQLNIDSLGHTFLQLKTP